MSSASEAPINDLTPAERRKVILPGYSNESAQRTRAEQTPVYQKIATM
jgi:hypothetical protein